MPQFLRLPLLFGTVFLLTNTAVLADDSSQRTNFVGGSQADAGYTSPGPAFAAPAYQSTANRGDAGHSTDNTWQDVIHESTPGVSIQAGVGQTQKTSKQNSGVFLPITETGSMAILGGYNRAACGKSFSGGFSTKGGGGGGPYMLPTTSTSCVDLNVCD